MFKVSNHTLENVDLMYPEKIEKKILIIKISVLFNTIANAYNQHDCVVFFFSLYKTHLTCAKQLKEKWNTILIIRSYSASD